MSAKVAAIPGGAKGIGKDIALELASKGWQVAICYRNSEQAAKATCEEIVKRGGQAFSLQADVAQVEAARKFVQEVEQRWGRIDALIHCAGPYHRIKLFDETPEGWNDMFAGNLHSLFYVAQAVVPGMIQRKTGRIVTFSMAMRTRWCRSRT